MIKKAAMFGLKVRIKQLCHPVSSEATDKLAPKGRALANQLVSGSHKLSTKKAAMFGLDARIALAIFGSLSVISGAALYSAIQEAKVTTIITEMNELNKSLEAYYLDTGSIELIPTTAYFNIADFFTNDSAKSGWNGPYSSLEQKDPQRLVNPSYDNYLIYRVSNNEDWGGVNGVDFTPVYTCTDLNRPCSYWIAAEYIPIDIAKKIDLKIDGTEGYRAGNLRIREYITGDTSGTATIFLKGMGEF